MRKVDRISILVVTCAVTAGVAVTAQAQSDSFVVPATQVDAVFADFDHTNTPGCALGVVRQGRLIYQRGYGMANLELGVPMTLQTVVDIGSITKQFTAMSVLMLAQQRKLSLDDDVRKYVPELPRYGNPITIRHLMHHTSGLRDYIILLNMAGRDYSDVVTDDEAFALLARQRALDFPTGERYSYSNSGYILMGLIVKRVTGQTLAQFTQEQNFDPLGMIHTEMHDDVNVMLVPNRATGHSRKEGGGVRPEIYRFLQTGDGGIFSTVEDLMRWDENFYRAQVGGAAVLEQMHVTGVLNDGKPISYAGGLQVEQYRGLRKVAHTGGGGGFSSAIIRFPEQHFSTIVACNMNGANAGSRAQKVADLYLAQAFTEPAPRAPEEEEEPNVGASDPVTLTPAQLASYAGDYWSDELGIQYWIEPVAAGLVAHIGDRTTKQLRPLKADAFLMQDVYAENEYIVVEFKRDGRGKATSLVVGAGPIHGLVFKRTR